MEGLKDYSGKIERLGDFIAKFEEVLESIVSTCTKLVLFKINHFNVPFKINYRLNK